MTDFADLADAGHQLGPLVRDALGDIADPVLLAVMPNGVPVALEVAPIVAAPVQALEVDRSADGVAIARVSGLEGRAVIVIDDGVETGTVARAAAAALRRSGVGHLILAVPVCPREAIADLQHRYDCVVAVVKPMARRDLSWHYRAFDTIDNAAASHLLSSANLLSSRRRPGVES